VKLYNMFTDCKPIQSSKGVKTKSENTGMSTFQTKDKALDHAVPTKADQTSVAKTSECIENRLVVDETFESNSKAGWHGGRISRSEKLGAFLGPFKSHHEVSKSFSVPSYATKIDLSFDFIQLGNWESEVGPEGPDRLFVYVNHVKMDLGYFRSGDKNPEVRVGKTNGGIRWNVQPNGEASHLYGEQESKDQVYRVTINVPKRYFLEGKISLRFLPSMKGTQDEFAAFDNLKIHSTIPCSVCKPKVRISFEDFENSRPLSGWHGGKIESGGTFTTFLGRLFSGNVARKIYAIPASANSVTIDMNIYEIDGFDGFGIDEKGTNGPDKIAVYVDKSRIDLGVFSHTEDEGTRSGVVNGIQWNMTSLTKPANIAFKGYYKDQKHRVLLSIPRNLYQDGRLELKVHADMHGMNDEYVGVDNLKLVANYDCSAAASHITDAVII